MAVKAAVPIAAMAARVSEIEIHCESAPS